MDKKVTLTSKEREIIRYTLNNHESELVDGIKLSAYTETGLDKVCGEIRLIGSIQSKLLFEVIT